MKNFFRRLFQEPPDPFWQNMERQFQACHAWDPGVGDPETAYRERFQRLCQFLLRLEPESGNGRPKKGELVKLRRALRKPDGSDEKASVQRLKELRPVLEELQRKKAESDRGYLDRIKEGLVSLRQQKEEDSQQQADRRKRLEPALRALGVPLEPTDLERTPIGLLSQLKDRIDTLWAITQAENKRIEGAAGQWQECFVGCLADWEWAYLQVLVRLARKCLEEDGRSEQCCASAEIAESCLVEAIEELEARGFAQPRIQGLYGRLAESFLVRARVTGINREKRLELIQGALTYARRAVEMEPRNANERRVLLEVLSLLGEFQEMKIEEIAQNLDSEPETLRAVGESFWNRAASMASRGAHKKVLREAVSFFEHARSHGESAPLDKSRPLKQMEVHGWAHYWLGRFQGELRKHDEAAEHLRIAAELGFKPLESRTRLALILLEARAYEQADRAFEEAAAEAERWPAAPSHSQAPGEDRPVAELRLEISIGQAVLCSLIAPAQGMQRITEAKSVLDSATHPKDKEEFEATLDEARGRVHLGNSNFPAAPAELEKALQKRRRSSAYYHLAVARLELALAAGQDAESRSEHLRKAREAYRLALETDRWGCLGRELWRLRKRLREVESKQPAAATPTSPPPPINGQADQKPDKAIQ